MLAKDPTLFAKYIQNIKFGKFPKLFRSQVDPAVVTKVLHGVDSALCAPDGTAPAGVDEPLPVATALRFINALAKTPTFDMTVMMFTKEDQSAAKSILLKCGGGKAASVASARAALGV